MFSWVWNWLQAPTSQKSSPVLWALVENYVASLAEHGKSEDSVVATKEYFSTMGVPVGRWTYSVERPTDEPEGFRWIPLNSGFGLKLQL